VTTEIPVAAGASAGPSPVVFQVPLLPRLFSLFAVAVIGLVSAGMTAFAVVLLFTNGWALGLFVVAPIAVFMAALTGYAARDLRGKWGLRVSLDAHAVTLDLPSGRSLIHRPPALNVTIPYADIEAIETRVEAYSSLGMAMAQRAYVLRGKRSADSGDLIFLFEDRALRTPFEAQWFGRIAADLAARAHVPVRDLGMVEGKGGVLAVWGTHAPDWAAPSLPLAQQLRLWRHVAFTGSFAIAVVIIALVIRLISGPLY
jgi:hypothetical protein